MNLYHLGIGLHRLCFWLQHSLGLAISTVLP